MANNYCQTSAYLPIHEKDFEQAENIVNRVTAEISRDSDEYEEEFGDCGVGVEVEKTGVWFNGEESFDQESLIQIAQALLDELEIDTPFYFSWAYTCSKLRLDEFGGGAGVVRRGEEPYTIDAMQEVIGFVER